MNESSLKIVLLVLSGDAKTACDWLKQNYASASLEIVSRYKLEKHSALGRVRAARQLRADIFVIATERLAWQRGQNAMLAFGALAGARQVVLIDSYGGVRKESGVGILARAPFRFAAESLASAAAIAQSRLRLTQLERAIQQREALTRQPAPDAIRIAYLRSTPSPGTPAGGAATHINGLINAAGELGAQLSVISNDNIAGLDESKLMLIDPEPIGITRAAFDLRNNLIFSAGVLREIERRPVDLIYQRYGRFTWAGVETSLRARVPLFLEYNGSEVWIGKHWDTSGMICLLERFERLNLSASTRIFVVSEVERQNLLRAGVPDEKIIVNPNGVDTQTFHPDVGGAAARGELGIGPDEILAGFVGTFGPWHGVLTLAKAICLLPADCRVRFLLVGAGKYSEEVEHIIRQGREQQTIFAGHVQHERVPALLDACDILLSPHVPLEDGSEFFGSPTKLFEYMAMGKGIVASRLGQIADVLADEQNALLIEPGSARQLADAILRLMKSRELRERLGAAARRAAIERHTWKQNAQRVINEYLSLSQGEREFG